MTSLKSTLPKEMAYIDFNGFGGPEVLRKCTGPLPKIGADEILIQVFAAGVNRPDLAQRAGKYPAPPSASPIPGLEVAGIVAAASETSRWRLGDRVCALAPGGGYAEFCKVPESHCLPIPQGFSMLEAAGIPETFFTVWANVFQIGKLQRDEKILIHGGASGIGTTAIQLAKSFGAEVFVTAGTDAKCEACLKLGADHAINYRTQAFEKVLLERTQENGVNLILDMIGGDYTPRNLASLASQGRLVQIATMQGAQTQINLVQIMQKRLLLTGSTLRPRSAEDKALIAQELYENVWPLFESRKVQVKVDQIFDFENVQEAHEYLEKGDHFGKVILEVLSEDISL